MEGSGNTHAKAVATHTERQWQHAHKEKQWQHAHKEKQWQHTQKSSGKTHTRKRQWQHTHTAVVLLATTCIIPGFCCIMFIAIVAISGETPRWAIICWTCNGPQHCSFTAAVGFLHRDCSCVESWTLGDLSGREREREWGHSSQCEEWHSMSVCGRPQGEREREGGWMTKAGVGAELGAILVHRPNMARV